MARPPRQLPANYQPLSDEQRRLRTAYADGDRSDAAREATSDFRAWKKLHPDVELPKLPPLPAKPSDDGPGPEIVVSEDPFPHGTPGGFDRGCRGVACANHHSAERMTCEQAKVRERGDWAYAKAVKAGTATDLKAGYQYDDDGLVVTIKAGQVRVEKHEPRREVPILPAAQAAAPRPEAPKAQIPPVNPVADGMKAMADQLAAATDEAIAIHEGIEGEPAGHAIPDPHTTVQVWSDTPTAEQIRAYVDEVHPRTNEAGALNASHVALEQTLRDRYRIPSYVASLDGPGHFRPEPINDVAATHNLPTFALEEPPIGEAPTPKADPLEQLQRELDQARLDLLNEQTANRHTEAEARAEISAQLRAYSKLEQKLRDVTFTRDGRDRDLEHAQEQLALADETILRQERQLFDLRAYTALAAVPANLSDGIWLKAYLQPSEQPSDVGRDRRHVMSKIRRNRRGSLR